MSYFTQVKILGNIGAVMDAPLGAAKPANLLQVGGNDGVNAYALPMQSGGGSIFASQPAQRVDGVFNALSQTLTIELKGAKSCAFTVEFGGNLNATFSVSTSQDGGLHYNNSTYFISSFSGTINFAPTWSTSGANESRGIVLPAGATHVQVSVSSYTSGNATVHLEASATDPYQYPQWIGTAARAQSPAWVQVAGTDGGNTRPLLTDSTGALILSSSGSTAANIVQWGSNNVVTGGVNGSVGVGGLAAQFAAAVGNPVIIAGLDGSGNVRAPLVDSTANILRVITANAATATDAVSNGQLIVPTLVGSSVGVFSGVGPYLFNGTTWDRQRSAGATGVAAVGGAAASGSAPSGNPILIGGKCIANGLVETISVSPSGDVGIAIVNNNSPIDGSAGNTFSDTGGNRSVPEVITGVFNGSTYDRTRSAGIGNNVVSTGILVAGAYGQYNATLPTITSGNYAALQTDSNARLLVTESSGSLATIATQTRNDAQIVDLLAQVLAQLKYLNLQFASHTNAQGDDDLDTVASTFIQ